VHSSRATFGRRVNPPGPSRRRVRAGTHTRLGQDPRRSMMTEQGGRSRAGARERVSDGIRQGIGVLSAFKEALEETIQEAKDRGDLSADRAKQVMKDALERAQSAAEDARERLDFVRQSEFDALRAEVAALRARVDALEASGEAG